MNFGYKKNLIFWGSPPPPIGGMSVHIHRLSIHLKSKKWSVYFYNFTKIDRADDKTLNVKNLFLWYLSLWFTKTPKIHYVITTRPYVRLLASLITLIGKKVILREGGRDLKRTSEKNFLNKVMNILSLKLCTSFIGVNKEICNYANLYISKKKIYNIPGFIIPPNEKIKCPTKIIDFFQKKSMRIVVCGQIFAKEKEDIYGLWDILKCIKLLKSENQIKNVKCVIILYQSLGINSSEINKFKEFIFQNNLEDYLLIFHSKNQLWPILKESNIFIRSSITDGDANSIREANHFNNFVIASDCVPRPKFCTLYKTNDVFDLAEKIKNFRKKKMKSYPSKNDNVEKIEKLLKSL